jgi:pterin-4a-carbinolamine dehydratase
LRDDGHRIERTFHFSNFRAALDFVRDVGDLAETEAHHPDVSFGWGYATISLRTKKIKGLHENDFIMASKIDRIFGAWNAPPIVGKIGKLLAVATASDRVGQFLAGIDFSPLMSAVEP